MSKNTRNNKATNKNQINEFLPGFSAPNDTEDTTDVVSDTSFHKPSNKRSNTKDKTKVKDKIYCGIFPWG